MSDKTIGKRFSHTYLVRGEPEKDSEKARFRLSKLAERSCKSESTSRSTSTKDYTLIAQENIENELGVKFKSPTASGRLVNSWEWYFNKVSVTEMLDTITVIASTIHNPFIRDDRRGRFVKGARRILKEENLAYDIDEMGGVHPLIDATFSAAMEAAISGLDSPRYAASAECVKKIDECLLQDPQDLVGAIRAVFGACENTFKLMYGVPRLDSKTAGDRIGGAQQSLYKDHKTLQAASSKTLESFKQWVNAAHFYRHEQGVEEPSQPAFEMGVLLISQGLSFVRWLAVLDRKTNPV